MYKVGILTVSDKCSQGERKDSPGLRQNNFNRDPNDGH